MIYQTHVQIANQILDRLDATSLTHLSKKEFIRGSNHPDYDLRYRRIKHEFYASKDIVHELLQRLYFEPMSRYERGFQLGIVAHFLADYMCSFHSNPYFKNKNLASHVLYEQKLYTLTKGLNVADHRTFVAHDIDSLWDEIEEFIANKMNEQSISHMLDYRHAVSLVEHVVHMVLGHTIPNRLHQIGYDNSLKVAIFTDTYYPQINGVSNTIYHYIKYLQQERIPYLLICPKYKETMSEKEDGYEIIRVASIPFLFYKEAKIALPNKSRLFQHLDDFKPTAIHVMTEFMIGQVGLDYAKQRNINVASNYSTNFVTYLDYLRLGFIKKPLTSYLRNFHQQATITTCPSSQTKSMINDLGIERVHVFGRGIHTKQFSPTHRRDSFRERFHEDPFIYLYVGRISAEKQLNLALAAFEQIHLHHPHSVFLVVGDGPLKKTYESDYPSATFLGYKIGDELAKIYASSDIFVFPSATETLGNVILEAMASGLPVITANKGGVLENVHHLHNGLIAQEQHELDYYTHMCSYLFDRDHLRRSRTNALKHVKSRSWSSIFQTQVELLKTMSEI